MLKYKKLLYISLLVAMAIVMHIVESMLPTSVIIPGAKLGLANLIILLTLVLLGYKAGFYVLILRIFISSLLIGTFLTPGFYLSLSGGILSYCLMVLAHKYLGAKFSLIGISLIGAVSHNIGQLAMAFILINNWSIFYYLPYLLLFALPTGFFIGLTVIYLAKHLQLNFEFEQEFQV
ncbi:Gx transporter family protein [Fuchsiella alkaliacetigena]|uniref:Gx transporter family protein n=1 Tax=Fuchsiella alkaliacetigena TaxID=957042 RepID=UPI00200AD7D7|nr:Gx transporter family protein [Fuchsiella alkaliacetigena]MCK8825596.1 Gx transporter family protein [Fuchsiella alkaliacetigena]